MKVLHVIMTLSKDSGGPARSVQGLVAAERDEGIDAWVWTLSGGDPWVDGVRVLDHEPSSSELCGYDLVHIHGIWCGPLHRVVVRCRTLGVKYVIAPRGMLEPWSLQRGWLKKRIARFLYQDRDIKGAAALHATATSEAEQFVKLGFDNFCIISPNGVNLPPFRMRHSSSGSARRALFVSRMHAKKGVLELVESWSRIRPNGWICELIYTINGHVEKRYEAQVKAKVKELGMEDQFVFTGELDDNNKWFAYARADLFVLPTYSENFGIVVAEALWAGVPVITTKGAPWSDLVESSCGWWIDLPPRESLDRALGVATSLPSAVLEHMGANGRTLVENKYSWAAVSKSMVRGYESILGR